MRARISPPPRDLGPRAALASVTGQGLDRHQFGSTIHDGQKVLHVRVVGVVGSAGPVRNDRQVLGYNLFGQLGLGDTPNRGDTPGEMGTNLPAVQLK